MTDVDDPSDEQVLIFTPTGRDAQLVAQSLDHEGIARRACSDGDELIDELERTAGALVVAEEALHPDLLQRLTQSIERQPKWSDLPVILLTCGGSPTRPRLEPLNYFRGLGNVTLLERPVRVVSLVSAVKAALRARRRQYEVRDYIGQLAETHRALEEADRRKNEFLAMLAHELRNPLAPIEYAVEILKRTPPDSELLREMQQMISRQVHHLARMVDDLLDINRIARGSIEIRHERLNLVRTLLTAIHDRRPQFDEAGLTLEVRVPERPVWIFGDAIRLTQIFDNLLSNALKFTPQGGRVEVELQPSADGDQVEIGVADSGIGIPPSVRERLFQPLSQAEQDLARTRGGLGLGLAIAKGLVALHKGTIEAQDRDPGPGTRFVIRLPQLPEAPPVKQTGDLPDHQGGRERVLVIEDNVDAAKTLAMLLKASGYEVSVAHDGNEGLQMARSNQPSSIICDIGLPGLSGFEVARRLRDDPRTARVRLIALTGYGSEGDRDESRQVGFDAHLVKPIELRTLLAELRENHRDG